VTFTDGPSRDPLLYIV